MRNAVATVVASLLFQIGAGFGTAAEDPHLGIVEYEISCLPCHGLDGRGAGQKAGTLRRKPADLTRIAKRNSGKFSSEKVADIIDGRAFVAGHGTREMPIWGERYRATTETNETPAWIDKRVRAQIAALVRYIQTLQEK